MFGYENVSPVGAACHKHLISIIYRKQRSLNYVDKPTDSINLRYTSNHTSLRLAAGVNEHLNRELLEKLLALIQIV